MLMNKSKLLIKIISFYLMLLLNTNYIFAITKSDDDQLAKLIIQKNSKQNHDVQNSINHYQHDENYLDVDNDIANFINNEKIHNNQNFDSLSLSSKVAVVQDLDTGEILYEKNGNVLHSIASISKLMSAMVILDSKLNMNDLIVITEDDIDKLKNSYSRLKVGTILSRRQLLHLGLMSSENRAIHALSRTYPGGVKTFIFNMNKKAYDIGMYDTIFFDSTGLDPRNQSTANDLLIMAKFANNYHDIRNYSTSNGVEIVKSTGATQRYKNSNVLVREGLWDINLQKTGYIKESGKCMVVMANLYGRSILMVLLGSYNSNEREKDALKIEQWLTP